MSLPVRCLCGYENRRTLGHLDPLAIKPDGIPHFILRMACHECQEQIVITEILNTERYLMAVGLMAEWMAAESAAAA